MKYPEFCKSVIDVTKPPYNADNTGKTDCTKALRRAIDDCLRGYITGLNKLRKKLLKLGAEQGGNAYVGAEMGRFINGEVYMTGPEKSPLRKIIYLPNGKYLVSDTVSYTFKNLVAPQQPGYNCELCRNVHIMGESVDGTVIVLADNARGYKKGAKKPVISFNRKSQENKETTNCAQMNILQDITVDCGKGNDGATGVLYAASNVGSIENVKIIAENGYAGIDFDYSTECSINGLEIHGFDYGIRTANFTAPVIIDGADLSGNKICGVLSKDGHICFNNVKHDDKPLLKTLAGGCGRFSFDENVKVTGVKKGNFIYKNVVGALVTRKDFPKEPKVYPSDDCAYVDDYGAKGDGKTDSTIAVQRAFNSGKKIVLFGEGNYLIERTVKIPKTVEVIDFIHCGFVAGRSIYVGEMEGMFEIAEPSEKHLFIKNMESGEQAEGFHRFIKQSATRNVTLKNLCAPCSMYFNTVGGSEVYIDNCFGHTNHYTQDGYHRDGYTPVFCRVIPFEFHGQKVYAKNLNIERADVELLNDNSEIYIDGYKTEGAGVAVKSINGGKTQINLFNNGIWNNKLEDHYVFDLTNSELYAVGGMIFGFNPDRKFNEAIKSVKNGRTKINNLYDCTIELEGVDALGRSFGRLFNKIKA
ncbi:MAG: hypothetical protein J5903_03085 [Clostridia bacterium]|nr:hypothetical protein [Clostridia bacterium]